MRYHFSEFVFDADTFELRKLDGDGIAMQPRALELLNLLLHRPKKLVTKEEILREVWNGVNVSSGALSLQVFKLRKALGDTEPPHTLQTIRRQGLRLDADVVTQSREVSRVDDTQDFAPAEEGEGLTTSLIGDQPSVAVLPFAHLDPADGLSTALPTDIITALSQRKLLRVKSSSSSFLFRSGDIPAHVINAKLGCDYFVGGAIYRAGERYDISVELVDASTGSVVWTDRFEIELRDVHDLRDQIVSTVVGHIETALPNHEALKLGMKEPDSLTAWQAFHTGASLIYRRGAENAQRSQLYLQRAVSIDSQFSRAWSALAHAASFEVINQPFDAKNDAKRNLLRFAEKAYEADSEDPAANLWLGRALAMNGSQTDPMAYLRRSIDLAPSYALAHQQYGTTLTFLKEHERALDHATASLKLNPHGPERYANYVIVALAAFRSGDLEASIEWSKKAGRVPFDNLHILLSPLCTYQMLGDFDNAKRIADRIKAAFPDVTQKNIFKLDNISPEFAQAARMALAANGVPAE